MGERPGESQTLRDGERDEPPGPAIQSTRWTAGPNAGLSRRSAYSASPLTAPVGPLFVTEQGVAVLAPGGRAQQRGGRSNDRLDQGGGVAASLAERLVRELGSAVSSRGGGIPMRLAVVLREAPPDVLGHRVTESVENRDRLDQCLPGDGCPADSGELPAQIHE